MHGTGLLPLKLSHWLYLDQIFLTISVHPLNIETEERYIIIYVWKILEGLVANLFPPISYVLKNQIVEGGPVSRHT